MQRGKRGWVGAFQELREVRPDVAGLVESFHRDQQLTFNKDLPAAYQSTNTWQGLTIVARGLIDDVDQGQLGSRGIYHTARVTIDGETIRVIVVDRKSNPLRSRRRSFEALRVLMNRHMDDSLMVMGNFNTPFDSVHWRLISNS